MTQPPSGAQTSPQPRMSEEDRIARLQLLRSPRVGPATYRRLMAAHGTAAEALRALPDLARSKGSNLISCAASIWRSANISPARKLARISFLSMKPATRACLAEISDAPPFLWVLGQQEQLTRPCVASRGRAQCLAPWARAWPIVWPQVLQKPV